MQQSTSFILCRLVFGASSSPYKPTRLLPRQPVGPLEIRVGRSCCLQTKGVRASAGSCWRSRVRRSCVWIRFGVGNLIVLLDSVVRTPKRQCRNECPMATLRIPNTVISLAVGHGLDPRCISAEHKLLLDNGKHGWSASWNLGPRNPTTRAIVLGP